MLKNSVADGTTFFADSTRTSHEYYSLGRTRTQTADTALSLLATAVSSVMVARGVKRDELFEKYDVKLWSYNDNLALFAASTIPAVLAMAGIFLAYRALEGFRVGVSI
jgi:hypothetical protein